MTVMQQYFSRPRYGIRATVGASIYLSVRKTQDGVIAEPERLLGGNEAQRHAWIAAVEFVRTGQPEAAVKALEKANFYVEPFFV